MRNLILSDRMKAVAELVPPQSMAVADIGCDHAYISIYLINNNIADKVIAMDVRKGPLDIAANNVDEFGVSDRIELRLSDGMDKLSVNEADAVIIAGMGGLLIRSILDKGIHLLESDAPPILILQPQSDIREVRIFLYEHSYHIVREIMVYEDGKYYTAILAHPGREPSYECDEDWEYGRYNIASGTGILIDYLENEARIYGDILGKLRPEEASDIPASHIPERTQSRIQDIENKLKLNREAYRRCKEADEMRRDHRDS